MRGFIGRHSGDESGSSPYHCHPDLHQKAAVAGDDEGRKESLIQGARRRNAAISLSVVFRHQPDLRCHERVIYDSESAGIWRGFLLGRCGQRPHVCSKQHCATHDHSLNVESEFQKEFIGSDVQGFCDSNKNLNCRCAFATLDAPDVIGMNVGLLCESFLAQPRLLSALENRFANGFPLKWLEHSSYGNRIKRNAPHTQRVGNVRLCLRTETDRV